MINLRIGHNILEDSPFTDDDPRGFVHIWEEPKPNCNYVVSCDPSYGLPEWSRSLRRDKDEETDNCAIEVIKIGRPDVQVAEYAGPIDPEDAARVVNFLGRLYGGASEDRQAHCIIEVQPGPGLLTQRELLHRFDYTNLFVWQHLDQMNIQMTKHYGWFSGRDSRQALWIRGTKHITQGRIILNSPALVEEMVDLRLDNWLNFTARGKWGCHDDRILATLLAIWAANQWSFDNPPEEKAEPEQQNLPDYQAQPVTLEEMYGEWNEKTDRLFS